jgi:hypothetical protein
MEHLPLLHVHLTSCIETDELSSAGTEQAACSLPLPSIAMQSTPVFTTIFGSIKVVSS